MNEVLVPADPVKLALAWLDGAYPDAWSVSLVKNRPNPTTGRVVAVRRNGGTRPLFVADNAWLYVECFADTDEDTADLARLTWGLLFAMAGETIDGVPCYRVDPIAGPADLPDADAEQPRYVMTVQASFRATPAPA